MNGRSSAKETGGSVKGISVLIIGGLLILSALLVFQPTPAAAVNNYAMQVTASPIAGGVPLTTTFTALACFQDEPGGPITDCGAAGFVWTMVNFGDGQTWTPPAVDTNVTTVSHTYLAPGVYTATFTAYVPFTHTDGFMGPPFTVTGSATVEVFGFSANLAVTPMTGMAPLSSSWNITMNSYETYDVVGYTYQLTVTNTLTNTVVYTTTGSMGTGDWGPESVTGQFPALPAGVYQVSGSVTEQLNPEVFPGNPPGLSVPLTSSILVYPQMVGPPMP